MTEEFINTIVSYDFLPHPLQPTRITDRTATLIDRIFLNSDEFFSSSDNLVCDLTDHKLFTRHIRNQSQVRRSRYKIDRNKLKHILNVSIKLYSNEYFAHHVNNVKATWRGIEPLTSLKDIECRIRTEYRIAFQQGPQDCRILRRNSGPI